MSIFSFGKSGPPPPSDKVWKTSRACLKGMVMQALLAIKNSTFPVIFTLFEESHQQLLDFMSSSGVPYKEINNLSSMEILQLKGTIALIDASSGNVYANIPPQLKAKVFLLGHYPLLSHEGKILDHIRATQPNAPITFCQSLDDALFHQLGTDNLAPLLERIGLTDDECIEHVMVTKAIHRAQEKISENVATELKARSEKEWYLRNCKK